MKTKRCPVPKGGTGRYTIKGNVKSNCNSKDARLKGKSRRPLHNSTATSKAGAASSAPTNSEPEQRLAV